MNALVRHVRGLWPRYPLLPGLPFVAWPLFAFVFLGEARRWELWALLAIGVLLPYANAASKKLYLGLWPVGAVAVLYDSMRFVKNVGLSEARIHACDLQAFDAALFGMHDQAGAKVTLHGYLQAHATPFWDAWFAVPYGTFIFVAILFAVWLGFKDYLAMRRFTLAFLAMNLLAFVTYHVFPAAPPWYVHAHGCAIDLASRASEGPNLARVDAMMGIPYFHGFYGRSNDVFGAMPSLHVAYPFLIVLSGWSRFRLLGRIASAVFFVSMCVAAVYLDHHWVIDVVVGLGFTAVVFAVLRRFGPRAAEATKRSESGALLSRGAEGVS